MSVAGGVSWRKNIAGCAEITSQVAPCKLLQDHGDAPMPDGVDEVARDVGALAFR